MITEEKAIEAIQKAIDEARMLPSTTYDAVSDFNTWRRKTIATLHRVVPDNKTIFKDMAGTKIYSGAFVERGIKIAIELLSSLIENIKQFGLEQPAKLATESGNGININLHQTQATHISINIEFVIDAIKDELKGTQVKELKEILASDAEPETKKKSFVEKIKSFGSDVASNILANIVTNPSVYEKMGGLF